MNPADAASALRALATRVRRNVPRSGDPERFHIEASEIARGMMDIAGVVDAGSPGGERRGRANCEGPTKGSGGMPITTRGRTVLTTTVIAGRRVTVQHRRLPFAIFARD